MKALTVCQPYAEQIACGVKIIENRTWATDYRGPLAIHAGKSKDWLYGDDVERYPGMAFGAVIATVELRDCVRIENLPPDLGARDDAEGPWCWLLENVRRVQPIAIKGALGLWAFPDRLMVVR